MHFLLLNQYGPSDSAPTARLLGDLAAALRASGHSVEVLAHQRGYHGRPGRGGRRLVRELRALGAILGAGCSWNCRRPHAILALSSPPGLPVVAALLAWRHRAPWLHWAMDLYPELAVALGQVRAGNPVVRLTQTAMDWAYRRAQGVIALDEDMRLHLQPKCRARVRVLEPWAAATVEAAAAQAMSVPSMSAHEPWTWLYAGNLGRAHEWQTLLDAQAILEARQLPVRLVFQGDGAARAPAREHATRLGLRHCEWTDYVPDAALSDRLLRAGLLVVTQRCETRGLLWPSKLALLERLPRPLLFIGPPDGAIAARLRARGGAGVFAPGEAAAAAEWVEGCYRGAAGQDALPVPVRPPAAERCGQLRDWLLECAAAR